MKEDMVSGLTVQDIPPETVKRILIIRNGALGDFILTLPVMGILKKAFPSAKVVAMASPAFLPLARDYVDSTIPSNVSGLYTLYSSCSTIPEHIRALLGNFDLAVSYTPDPGGTFIQNLRNMGIPWVIDGAFSASEECGVPAMERLIAPLRLAGIPAFSAPPRIIPSPPDSQFALKFLRSLPDGEEASRAMVAIHPGSGNPKKCWPPAKYAQLALWAKETFGATIVLILGPADQYIVKELDSFIATCKPVLASHLSITHVAALLRKSTVYVGNDSGITHLAAAVDTPTIALFGPTDHRIWGPQNEGATCLRGMCLCAPCAPERMAQCDDSLCMESLPLASVQKAVRSFIARFGYSFPNGNINDRVGRRRYHVQG